jgi:hypothetical protein
MKNESFDFNSIPKWFLALWILSVVTTSLFIFLLCWALIRAAGMGLKI